MTRLDRDGQPVSTAYNFRRNREKAAFALRGILQGVVADKKLVPQELLFLDTWLRSQQQLDEGDVVDLLDLIRDILEDGVITDEELSELYALINDVIEYGEASSAELKASINELLGMLNGIVADGKVTEAEFHSLNEWLKDHDHVVNHWPANEIAKRIQHILADGVVDDDELADLQVTLKQMCGNDFEESGTADGGVAEVFSAEVETFDHDGRTMMFTGKFVCGSRDTVRNAAKERGAKVVSNLSKKVDVLVIGTLGSRDWKYTSYGGKIEAALQMQRDGVPLVI
ncbi:MAG: NAD-dependent DNA ligase, partial [Rhodothermales bacterium]|nr:NAD-dependent DNA ligase [Rhodothermales bacterium]